MNRPHDPVCACDPCEERRFRPSTAEAPATTGGALVAATTPHSTADYLAREIETVLGAYALTGRSVAVSLGRAIRIAEIAVEALRHTATLLDVEREERDVEVAALSTPRTVVMHGAGIARGPLDSGVVVVERRISDAPRQGHDRRDVAGIICWSPARDRYEAWLGGLCRGYASTPDDLRRILPRADVMLREEVPS